MDDLNLAGRDTELAALVWNPGAGVEGKPQSVPLPVFLLVVLPVVGTVAAVVERSRSSSPFQDCTLDILQGVHLQYIHSSVQGAEVDIHSAFGELVSAASSGIGAAALAMTWYGSGLGRIVESANSSSERGLAEEHLQRYRNMQHRAA